MDRGGGGRSIQPDSAPAWTPARSLAGAAGNIPRAGTACRFRWGIFMVVITNPPSGGGQKFFFIFPPPAPPRGKSAQTPSSRCPAHAGRPAAFGGGRPTV